MTHLFDRRYSPATARWMYRLLGAALAGLAVQEWLNGHLQGHAGQLWLRRLPALPLLPPAAAAALWAAQAACGLGLSFGVARRAATRLGTALLCVSLTQCWFNQKMMLALSLLALALDPPDPEEPGFADRPRPGLALIQAQLLLVYAATVLYKLRDGFWSGDALLALFEQLRARGLSGLLPAAALGARLTAGRAATLSTLVLAAEAAIPPALILRPRRGFIGVVALHAALALFMPGIWPFTAAMAGAAVLFLDREEWSKIAP